MPQHEQVQCANCGKFYPDFVRRDALFRTRAGTLTDGGMKGCSTVFVLGLFLALLGAAFFGCNLALFFTANIPFWVIDALYISGGTLLGLSILYGLVLIFRKTAGYRYTCKACGNRWQVEAPTTRALS